MIGDSKNKVQHLATTFNQLIDKFKPLRTQQVKSARYAVGDMIDKDILDDLKKQKRPALMFQLIQPQLLFVAGTIKRDRKKLKAYPTRMGDEALSSMHTVLVDWAMDNCDGYDEFAKAALDAAIMKIGFVNGHWSYRGNSQGKYILKAEDPFSILFDPDGKQSNTDDWRYEAKHGMYTAGEAINIFMSYLDSDMILEIKTRSEELEGIWDKSKQDGRPIGYYQRDGIIDKFVAEANIGVDLGSELVNNLIDVRNNLYRVIEWHDRRQIEKRVMYSPVTGKSEPIPDELYAKEREAEYKQFVASSAMRVPEGRVKINNVEQLWVCATIPALLPDKLIFEQPYFVQEKGFQYKPIFWYDFHPNLLQTSSLLDSLISPSDLFNQRQMTMLEYLRDSLNPSWLYPEGSIKPTDKEVWESKVRGRRLPYTVQAGGLKPEPIRPDGSVYQMAKAQSEEMKELIPTLTGNTPNLMGRSETSNEPASLYTARVEQGMVMLAYPFANIYKCMRQAFGYCDTTLQKFMPFERKIRLLEEPPEGMQGVTKEGTMYWLAINQLTMEGIQNDITQGEYDFRVDVAALGQTEKKLNSMIALELAQAMPPEFSMGGWADIVRMQDIPGAKEWAAFIDGQVQMMLQQQQMQQQVGQVQTAIGIAGQVKQLKEPQEKVAA